MKKILILLFAVISLTVVSQSSFDWEVISGVEKLVATEDMSKTKIKKLEAGKAIYSEGIEKMKQNKYPEAIEKFKIAERSYKAAKISEHSYNYININQALCYANLPKPRFELARKSISSVTSKIKKEKKWLYNLAIANNKIQDYDAAISNLTIAIRLDENYFQAYITLEAIHRNLGDKSNADKVRDKMEIAEDRLNRKRERNKKKVRRIKMMNHKTKILSLKV